VITGGVSPGSTRVFGTGRPNLPTPPPTPAALQIWSAGPNRIPEAGGADDELIGGGGTNSFGSFFDGAAGIGLTRPLEPGELIYAIDTSDEPDLVGPPVAVGLPIAPAPVMSWMGLLVVTLMLAAVGMLALRRLESGRMG
jgi:hypothetical protein